MCTEQPAAVVTVYFTQQVISARLIAGLVQQLVADDPYAKFSQDERFYNGPILSFGQSGGRSGVDIRIVPSLDTPYFRIGDGYTQVEVTSHNWGMRSAGRAPSKKEIIAAVQEFADNLRAAYSSALTHNDFPQYEEPADNEK